MIAFTFNLLAILCFHLITANSPQQSIRHEFKHSIRKPYFIHPLHNADYKNSTVPLPFIPHYKHSGSVVPGPADLSLRMVPSVPRARGLITAERPLFGPDDNYTALSPDMAKGWSVHLDFTFLPSTFANEAASSGKLTGHPAEGVGLAFWLTTTPFDISASVPFDINNPMYGIHAHSFDGLRISVQSIASKDHPYNFRISGAMSFESVQKVNDLGHCEVNLGPGNPSLVIEVKYSITNKELEIWHKKSIDHDEWDPKHTFCFKNKVDIPNRGGYMSISAANGDLDRTNDIDIVAMDVFALEPVHRSRPIVENKIMEAQKKHKAQVSKEEIERAHEIEKKVHKLIHQAEEEKLKQAKKEEQQHAKPADPATPPATGSQGTVSSSQLTNLEAAVALLSSQVLTLSANVLKVKELIQAQPSAGTGAVKTENNNNKGDEQWQHTVDSKLEHITTLTNAHHQDLVSLVHQVSWTGENAHETATRAHDLASSAAHAATQAATAKSENGHSWVTLFLLMLGAQCVGMVMVTIWRTIRGSEKQKKYL